MSETEHRPESEEVRTESPLVIRLGDGAARWAYEGVMVALALAVVGLLTQPNEGAVRLANLAIWGVFVVDYVVRLTLASDRRRFVRANLPDLVAVLPLDFLRVARVLRLARLVRLLRAGTVLWRTSITLREVLRTNGLQWVLAAAVSTVLVGGTLVWATDPTIRTFGDGIWWAMVTSTTVGYGDLSPVSGVARGVAVVVMVVGVGTLGMLTGSVATYFAGSRTTGPSSDQVEFIRDRLADWDELPAADRRELAAMLGALAEA